MAKRISLDLTEQLRQAIAVSGMSLRDVSSASGVDYAILYRFAHRQRGMTLESASRVAKCLGLVLRKGGQ